eukprot:1148775-Pelagomonas_calceolata.AAC.8
MLCTSAGPGLQLKCNLSSNAKFVGHRRMAITWLMGCLMSVACQAFIYLCTYGHPMRFRSLSTRRGTVHNQGGANSTLPYDVESGLPADTALQHQQQQQGATSISVLEQPSSVMTRLLGNAETALAGEDSEADNGGKPPMLPLATWPPIKAAASKHPSIRTVANVFDRVWLLSSQLARSAPPPARVGLVSYLLFLHIMSWMEIAGVWHRCP